VNGEINPAKLMTKHKCIIIMLKPIAES